MPGAPIPVEARYFSLLRNVTTGFGPTQTHVELVWEGSLLGVKRSESEINHSALSSAEVESMKLSLHSPIRLHCVDREKTTQNYEAHC